jgi:Zn-dependent peptidase ImmA (M78 family)
VTSIAEDLLGLRVEHEELDVSGMLLPAERRIFVNASESEPRRRFTIAHELGHWICQCLEGTAALPIMCRPRDVVVGTDRALEREANLFAAELLMPEDALRAAGTNTFGVSDVAYRWRRYSLGLGERPR